MMPQPNADTLVAQRPMQRTGPNVPGAPNMTPALGAPGNAAGTALSHPTLTAGQPGAVPGAPMGAAIPALVGQRPAPTGPAADIRPSTPTQTPQVSAQPTPAAPSGAAPGAQGAPGAYATLQPTDPSHSLLGQTILPGQGTDRYGIAQQQFNTFQQQTNPAYEASLRDANRYAAAGGALGSGMLNTSVGDLANQRNLQLQGAQQSFLQNALSGSIEDQYRNLGILQQQQQFQREQQNDAFGQGLAQSQFGYQGNPADTSLMLANLYGNNAAAAGAGVGSLIQNSQLNQAMSNNPMWQILRGQYGGAGGSSPAPSAPQGPTDQYGLPTGLPKTFPGGV